MDSIFASSLSILEPQEQVQSEGVADRLDSAREDANQTSPNLMISGISANLLPILESIDEVKVKKEEEEEKEKDNEKKEEEEEIMKNALPNDQIEQQQNSLSTVDGDEQPTIVVPAAAAAAAPKRGRPPVARINDFEMETDPVKRRRAQNREAARRYRERKKMAEREMMEEATGISANLMPVLESMVEVKKEEEDVMKDELPADSIETVPAPHEKALVSIGDDGVKSAAADPARPKRGRPRISEGTTDSQKETDPEKRKKAQKREAAHRYREKKKKRVEMGIIAKMQERSAFLNGRVHELKAEIDHWKAKCTREFNFTPDSEFKIRRVLPPPAAALGASIDGVAPGHAQSHTQHRDDILLREETDLAVRRIPALRTALLTHYVEITRLRRQMGIDANVRTTADEAVLDMFRAVPPLSYCIQIP